MTSETAQVLYSVQDAANRLAISVRTLASETKAGRISHVRVRSRVLYRPEALLEYAQQNERPAARNDVAL